MDPSFWQIDPTPLHEEKDPLAIGGTPEDDEIDTSYLQLEDQPEEEGKKEEGKKKRRRRKRS